MQKSRGALGKISLVNTLLGRNYSIHKQIGTGRNSVVYGAVSIKDKK